MTVDFQDIVDYTMPEFQDSWAFKNCMLGSKMVFQVQSGTTVYAVDIGRLCKSVFSLRYVAAVEESPVSISDRFINLLMF